MEIVGIAVIGVSIALVVAACVLWEAIRRPGPLPPRDPREVREDDGEWL